VQNVTWCEAIRFANAASRVEGREPAYHIPTPCNTRGGPKLRPNLQMPGFRLPTVVEWEMAARSDGGEAWGRTGMEHELCAFANVRDLSAALAFGWSSGALCDDGSAGTWNVGGGGRAAGNALGLVDMIGNVREWCWDAYAPRNPNARVDPPTTDKGTRREERGGSWRTSARWARIANRSSSSRTFHGDDLGFRLGRSVRPTTGRR
jgi:formylglycine-generating enzyme required for sulfatase activity